MKIKISTHKPRPALWFIALLLFIYALVAFFLRVQLPGWDVAIFISAALVLLGTTVV